MSVAIAAGPARAADKDDAPSRLPRYASLRAAEVNLRTGPGTRYPIDWVYQHRSLPVQIIGEFNAWRQIRDFEGTTGWVHKSMLSGRRAVIVLGGERQIRRSPGGNAVLARVEAKVVGQLLRCQDSWCRVDFRGIRGWLPKEALWGVEKDE